jgi:citrate synthase
LEGVEVDETAIAFVDGEHGALSYRGVPIATLVTWPFSRVVWLVLTGREPNARQQLEFDAALLSAGRLTASDERLIDVAAATATHSMHVMQGVIPLLDTSGARAFEALGFTAESAPGLVVAAKLPRVLARLLHAHAGRVCPPASEANDPIVRFLHDATGSLPRDALIDAFRVTQILQIEHGFNAGTFASRVVASTLAPITNAIAAGLGALHGPLHGGADQAALEMADAVGDPARALAFVDECVASGRKIMGMGHREYKTLDPRARFVKDLARKLSKGTPLGVTFATLEAIEARFNEQMKKRGKSLPANLEFYKGVVYRAAGLSAEYFTATFGCARAFGYVAHFIESRTDNRIIRPSARYIGPTVAA